MCRMQIAVSCAVNVAIVSIKYIVCGFFSRVCVIWVYNARRDSNYSYIIISTVK